uniref:Probable N-acetyl-gamma-glutamyl-phosphate reductase, chloroplastic n=1 Tax=Physcomitrium patens TaxID=3218 RepID=A0A7I4FUW3_PHYPA
MATFSQAGMALFPRSTFIEDCGASTKSSFLGNAVGSELLVVNRGARTRMAVTSAPKNREITKSSDFDQSETVRVGVLGASGYTGSEDLPNMVAVKDADFLNVDAVFCCLPHGTTQEIIAALPKNLKVVDLSADFRLRNTATYEEWYNGPHRAPELQPEAVYGLTELCREEVRAARLVANPGCYPTSIQLPLIPLLKAGLIEKDNIIINSNSGVSGAGRSAKEANLYTEICEGIHPYGITKHRHVPEIEQGLSDAVGSDVTISFTPNLMPMSRGMMSTMFVQRKQGVTVDDLRNHLVERFSDEEFVVVLEKDIAPHTRHVRGSNYCLLNVFEDRIPGRAIIISAIDNLVKGASGQALQNLNLMMGCPENCGLLQQPMFP